MDKGVFGGMFDFNRDGHISPAESAAECMFFHEVIIKDKKQGKKKHPSNGFKAFKAQSTDKR